MKVLITGASGNVGGDIARLLACHGFDLTLTDRRPGTNLPTDVITADLLDPAAVAHLVRGIDAVVHLGNHPNFQPGRHDPRTIHGENTAMNLNVFEAALDAGVRKLVFFSSIQVIHGDRIYRKSDLTPLGPSRLPYLPIDCNTPTNARNPYSLSKLAAEQYLSNWIAPRGVECVAIRLPYAPTASSWEHMRKSWRAKTTHPTYPDEGLALLHAADAGRLVAAVLRSTLHGYRVYQPAAESLIENITPAEAVAKYFAGVELRGDVTQMRCLVDNRRLTAETGWTPRYALSDETYDPASAYNPDAPPQAMSRPGR